MVDTGLDHKVLLVVCLIRHNYLAAFSADLFISETEFCLEIV